MKKTLITIAAIMVASTWITACSPDTASFPEPPVTTAASTDTDTAEETTAAESDEPAFSTGTWDGYTFSSPWLNISITFPEGSTISTEEQINEIIGAGSDVLQENDIINESQSKASALTTTYDLFVILPDQTTNIQLMHENVSIATLGKGMSAEDYIAAVKTQLSALPGYEYEFGELESVTLGGQEFTKMSTTAVGGALIQDYYVISKGKYVSGLAISYTPENAELVASIISGITAAK